MTSDCQISGLPIKIYGVNGNNLNILLVCTGHWPILLDFLLYRPKYKLLLRYSFTDNAVKQHFCEFFGTDDVVSYCNEFQLDTVH